jgi:hypothetical protein
MDKPQSHRGRKLLRTKDKMEARIGMNVTKAIIDERAILGLKVSHRDRPKMQPNYSRSGTYRGDFPLPQTANLLNIEGFPCVILDEPDALKDLRES